MNRVNRDRILYRSSREVRWSNTLTLLDQHIVYTVELPFIKP